jgi:hypothetical protein
MTEWTVLGTGLALLSCNRQAVRLKKIVIEQNRREMRCRTICLVRTVQGDLPQNSHGTIQREMENFGRHLILVTWHQGFTVPVFPPEIEVGAGAEARV